MKHVFCSLLTGLLVLQAAPTSNVKIDIKTAKNYKVDNIEIFYRDGSYKTVKNGAKVSLKIK
nr:hypothetical protein [uncultured Blautia sp.]